MRYQYYRGENALKQSVRTRTRALQTRSRYKLASAIAGTTIDDKHALRMLTHISVDHSQKADRHLGVASGWERGVDSSRWRERTYELERQ